MNGVLIPPVCTFCGVEMKRAAAAVTVEGSLIAAYLCPKCSATHYACNNKMDPCFQLIAGLGKNIQALWLSLQEKEK